MLSGQVFGLDDLRMDEGHRPSRRRADPGMAAMASSTTPSLRASLLVQRGDEHGEDCPILRAIGLGLDGDEPGQVEDTQAKGSVLDHDRVWQDLVVAFALAELAEDVELSQVRLQVDVAAAEERIFFRWQPAIGEIEPMVRAVAREPGQQPSDVSLGRRCTMSRSWVTIGAPSMTAAIPPTMMKSTPASVSSCSVRRVPSSNDTAEARECFGHA